MSAFSKIEPFYKGLFSFDNLLQFSNELLFRIVSKALQGQLYLENRFETSPNAENVTEAQFLV